MVRVVLREILHRLRRNQTLSKPVKPVCVRKTNRSVCPTAIGAVKARVGVRVRVIVTVR